MPGPALLDRIDQAIRELHAIRAEVAAMLPAAEGNGATEADDLAPDSLLDTGLGSLRLSAGHHSQVVPHRLGVHAGGRWQVSIPTAATAHREIKRGRFVKAKRTYRVTVTRQRDYSATISIRAGSQGRGGPQGARGFLQVRVSSEDFGARTQLIGAE